MITIHLHGILEQFSKEPISLHARDMGEVMENLLGRFGNRFRNIIEEGSWHLVKSDKLMDQPSQEDSFLSEEELKLPLNNNVHLFPAITGAGKGVGQIILGVVLIVIAVVIAIYTGGASLGAIAGGLTGGGIATSLAVAGVLAIAGGVMAMVTKTPTMGSYESAAAVDARPSFLFNGVVNNTEQGVAVPLVYGLHLTGSTVIYAGMDVEQL